MTRPSEEGVNSLGGSADRLPRFVALGLPDADVPVWTPDRIDRHAALTDKSKGCDGLLGRLYGTAVNLLAQLEVPGSIAILAHCVREIYNRYSDFDGFAVPKRQDERNRAVRSLEEVWVTIEERSGDLEIELTDGFADDPLLSIPRSVHLAVDAVVAAERAATEAARQRHRYYMNAIDATAFDSYSGPSETEASRCFQFFQGYAHVGTTPHAFQRAEVEQQFALFDRLLDNRLLEFLNASDEVAGLLAEANTPRRTDGDEGRD